MPGPFDAAGAEKQPSRYSALGMGSRQFTGLWTQRSPYRDAAVSYLIGKFYGGSRIDSILDGLNREISMRLTDVRRPGNPVWNSNLFPGINSFYSFSRVINGTRTIDVLADGMDGTIYGASGGKTSLFTKTGTTKTRFLGVANELFFSDTADLEAWLTPAAIWQASTNIKPGTLINSGAKPYNLQMALGGITLNIVATSSDGTNITIYTDPSQVPEQFANLQGISAHFTGLTVATSLNGNSYAVTVVSSTLGILRVTQAQAAYVRAIDTGSGTTGTGTTGGSLPAFSATKFAITADGGQQWKCYGPAMMAWGLPAPTKAPVLAPANGARFWQAGFTPSANNYAILDSNQNVEIYVNGTTQATGNRYPIWAAIDTTSVGITNDGTAQWYNVGPIRGWKASSPFYTFPSGATGGTGICVILDPNGNLQWVTNGSGGNSGGTAPAWATGLNATTTDGALTWTCLGPGATLTTATVQYAFSTHGVDGSVSTASPVATVFGPILGPNVAAPADSPLDYLTLTMVLPAFPSLDQTDYLDIWRCPQGQLGTLVLEDQYPLDTAQTHVSPPYAFQVYDEIGIPDTSADGTGALNAFILAPTAKANQPPPAGATAPAYHLNRVWMIQGNKVIYSGGPDTIVGNGNTAFPPLNAFGYQGVPIRLVPVTVQNGGLLVYTTAGIFIILGTGTPSNPFYSTTYYDKVFLGGYDALDTFGTEHFLMESNLKVSSIAVQYPFNPQTGYTEIGFPIGDQFLKMSTAGLSTSIYNASTAFLTWNIANTTDNAMYVADGAIGWFRMSNVAPPESGLIWSPFAQIATAGTSAVQSIETAPGVFQLLIGPSNSIAGGAPILARDTTGTIFYDGLNTPLLPALPYAAWDVKGVTKLCSTGEMTELGWISTKSMKVGKKPTIGLLMNEIEPGTSTPFTILQWTSPDPAILPPSQSVYSDQYSCEQNGVAPKGDSVSLKFDYGAQFAADELLDFEIYGTKDDYRPAPTAG